MTAVYKNRDEVIEIDAVWIERLKQAARQEKLGRARLCLHLSQDDLVQEMLIAFCRGSYIRPHRHVAKSESFHVVEGELLVVLFGDDGKPIREFRMGPLGSGKNFIYRLASDTWHTVVPLSEYVVIHETTTGPWDPNENQVAPWSPDESSLSDVEHFLAGLSNDVNEGRSFS